MVEPGAEELVSEFFARGGPTDGKIGDEVVEGGMCASEDGYGWMFAVDEVG